jgi:hypothetical protein
MISKSCAQIATAFDRTGDTAPVSTCPFLLRENPSSCLPNSKPNLRRTHQYRSPTALRLKSKHATLNVRDRIPVRSHKQLNTKLKEAMVWRFCRVNKSYQKKKIILIERAREREREGKGKWKRGKIFDFSNSPRLPKVFRSFPDHRARTALPMEPIDSTSEQHKTQIRISSILKISQTVKVKIIVMTRNKKMYSTHVTIYKTKPTE